MFWCRACKAKDEEIHHLLALLHEANERAEKATARLTEAAAPGVNARIAPPVRRQMTAPPARPVVGGFPGYERELGPQPIEAE